jgi:hypothetical protein
LTDTDECNGVLPLLLLLLAQLATCFLLVLVLLLAELLARHLPAGVEAMIWLPHPHLPLPRLLPLPL